MAQYPNENSVVYGPCLPYHGTIPHGAINGTLIVIYGKIPFGAKRFAFNMMVGSVISNSLKEHGDVAFHFNPRLDDNCVVRNTRQHSSWGPEERGPFVMPFQSGRDFEAMILVSDRCYKVAINGTHFIEYAHRIPISAVGVFSIEGDVIINRIEYRRELRNQHYQPLPTAPIAPYPSSGGHQSIFNPPMPFRQSLANGIYPGMMIYISGRPSHSSIGFSINFACGMSPYNRDIAFHFNPRMNESVIVRNTQKDGQWQIEERGVPHFPFRAGVNFDMIIRVESNRYMVAINGQHFLEYNHRIMPLNIINMLEIDGDLIIASIRFG